MWTSVDNQILEVWKFQDWRTDGMIRTIGFDDEFSEEPYWSTIDCTMTQQQEQTEEPAELQVKK